MLSMTSSIALHTLTLSSWSFCASLYHSLVGLDIGRASIFALSIPAHPQQLRHSTSIAPSRWVTHSGHCPAVSAPQQRQGRSVFR